VAIHTLLQGHLDKVIGTGGYTVSGAVATVTASLDHRRLQELLDVATEIKHDVTLVSGVPKVTPR
jgi:hypothetical protein